MNSLELSAKVAVPVPLEVLTVSFVVPEALLKIFSLISFAPLFSITSTGEIVTVGVPVGVGVGVGVGKHGSKLLPSRQGGGVGVGVGVGIDGMVLQLV